MRTCQATRAAGGTALFLAFAMTAGGDVGLVAFARERGIEVNRLGCTHQPPLRELGRARQHAEQQGREPDDFEVRPNRAQPLDELAACRRRRLHEVDEIRRAGEVIHVGTDHAGAGRHVQHAQRRLPAADRHVPRAHFATEPPRRVKIVEVHQRAGPDDLDLDAEVAAELRREHLGFRLAPHVRAALQVAGVDRCAFVDHAAVAGLDHRQAADVQHGLHARRRAAFDQQLRRRDRVALLLGLAAARLRRAVHDRVDALERLRGEPAREIAGDVLHAGHPRRRRRHAARHRPHGIAGVAQLLDHSPPEEPGAAGDQHHASPGRRRHSRRPRSRAAPAPPLASGARRDRGPAPICSQMSTVSRIDCGVIGGAVRDVMPS